MRLMISTLLLGFTLFFACTENTENTSRTPMPADAVPANVSISELNYWVEKDRFFVVGICDNLAGEWQKIWLQLEPMDATGKPVAMKNASDAVFPAFSEAVPPRGRTSFFANWPLKAFSDVPDSCRVTGAGAVAMPPGAILIPIEQSGVKMLVSKLIGDSVITEEKAWQVSAVVENPLEVEAAHPRLEVLLYGTDRRLWYSVVFNPEDPATKQTVGMEREGPMMPHEKRRIGGQIVYDSLPQKLQEIKIGRAEFQAFDARQ